MPPSLTVVGSINLDLVATVPRLPRPGETLTGARLDHVPGGKGANQAVAAARLGADVRFVGAVGDDDFGSRAISELCASGVDLSGLVHVDTPTGIALILVDDSGENQIVVVPGANHALDASTIGVGEPDALVCQLETLDEPIEAALRRSDAFFCLNAAPARPVPAAILERADLIVANSLELEALGSSPMGALFALTLGAEGALLARGRGRGRARARPRRWRRSTGRPPATPSRACLVVSLVEGREREEALRPRVRSGGDRRLAARCATVAPHSGGG